MIGDFHAYSELCSTQRDQIFEVKITNWPCISPEITSKNRKLAHDFYFDEFRVRKKPFFSSFFYKKMTFRVGMKKSF